MYQFLSSLIYFTQIQPAYTFLKFNSEMNMFIEVILLYSLQYGCLTGGGLRARGKFQWFSKLIIIIIIIIIIMQHLDETVYIAIISSSKGKVTILVFLFNSKF